MRDFGVYATLIFVIIVETLMILTVAPMIPAVT